MRQSKLFFKTQKEFPKDEVAVNARFLVRANFVEKLMAGVYSLLPLGLIVKKKVEAIVREEMNRLGADEIAMPALQPRSLWDLTGRWEGMAKVMYQFKDSSGRELGLGTTHEEIVVTLAKNVIFSYADLPKAVYQIQTKFRNEPRAKSGLLRGREFTMKDLYSFHADESSQSEFYESCTAAYKKIFNRCGLKAYVTEASGGDFSKVYSHEFQVEAEAGEDEIFLCRLCGFARNKEIANFRGKKRCPQCQNGVLDRVPSIEVGNIFKLGTRFSEAARLYVRDQKGNLKPVVMGSYGIGIERLIGTIVEVHHDEKGIIWPLPVAPFPAHLLVVGEREESLQNFADYVYQMLHKHGHTVLYDDRKESGAGEKFFDADLIGIPWRLVVSEKTLVQNKVEVKRRDEKEAKLMKLEELIKILEAKKTPDNKTLCETL